MDKNGEEVREQKGADAKRAANVLSALPETAGLDPFGMFCAITHPLCEGATCTENEQRADPAPQQGVKGRTIRDA